MSSGIGGVVNSFQPSNIALWDEDRSDLYTGRYYWDYQHRGPQSNRYQGVQWHQLWPLSKMCSGDSTVSLTLLGNDISDGRIGAGYEEWRYGEGGQLGQVFIRGQCVDMNGNPLGACTVQAFVTNPINIGNPNGVSADVLAGTTITDSNGNYACPTPYPGVAHFVVAYYAATNLSGTTVNTLIPTN